MAILAQPGDKGATPGAKGTDEPTDCQDIGGQNSPGAKGTAQSDFDVALLDPNGYIAGIADEVIQFRNVSKPAELLGHDIRCNASEKHCFVGCGQLAGCLNSKIYIGDGANDSDLSRDVVILCYEQVSCFGATVNTDDLRQGTDIVIICSAESACNGMTIRALNFGSFHVYCSQSEACSDMVVHIDVRDDKAVANRHDDRYGSIWCTVPNACDGLMINTSSIWTTLWMFEWSYDVVLDNGYGYEDNIECNNNRFFYRQWINETEDTITEIILAEYESDHFPCDGVQVQCNGSSCDMEYNLKTQTILSLETNFATGDCYWFNLEEIQKGLSHILDVAIPKTFSPDKSVGKKFFKLQHLRCGTGPLNCLGECVTSPTTPPSAAPTSAPAIPTVKPTGDPTNAPSGDPTSAPSSSPTQYPTVYPIYNGYIETQYSLHNLSTANKLFIGQSPALTVSKMIEILERGYLERSFGNLEYKDFSLRIDTINDVVVDTNTDLTTLSKALDLKWSGSRWTSIASPMVLGATVDIIAEAASLIKGNSDDQFSSVVTVEFQGMFNNSDVLFVVDTSEEDMEIIAKYSAEQSPDRTPIYTAISILSVGALSSGAAFIWDKLEATNSDESRWMAPMILSIHLYDFVSDIILCYTICKSALNEGVDHNSTLLWLAIGSAATIIVPLLLNTLYATRIRKQKTIIGNPTASNWCVFLVSILSESDIACR